MKMKLPADEALRKHQERWSECHEKHKELLYNLSNRVRNNFLQELQQLLEVTDVIRTNAELIRFDNAYITLQIKFNVYCGTADCQTKQIQNK
jgi:hypothetical protein